VLLNFCILNSNKDIVNSFILIHDLLALTLCLKQTVRNNIVYSRKFVFSFPVKLRQQLWPKSYTIEIWQYIKIQKITGNIFKPVETKKTVSGRICKLPSSQNETLKTPV
jgi:hypothetical protein